MLYVVLKCKDGKIIQHEWGEGETMVRTFAVRMMEDAGAERAEVWNEKGELIFEHPTDV